jgi:CheY-specific phosphatase CheX
MNEKIERELTVVAMETLEKLAFLFPTDDEAPCVPETGEAIRVAVSFDGPFGGTLLMEMAGALLPDLAGNMLGIDDTRQVTRDQQHDALKETANIICGNLLPVIAGGRPVFEIGPPRVMEKEDVPDSGAAAVVRLAIEGHACALSLYVRGDVPGRNDTMQSEFRKQ